VEHEPILRRRRRKLENFVNLTIATFVAFVAGVEVFVFSSNPLVFVSIGLGVGIVFFKTSDRVKLLIFGALVGTVMGALLVCISSVERSLIVWMGVSIVAFIATFVVLHPRFRQRLAWKALFSASFASVCFTATLVIFATFLSPSFFCKYLVCKLLSPQ
jgi:hypothetical protein